VGYTSKEAAQGKFLIIGAQFEGVADGNMKINDLVSGVQGVDYDNENAFQTTAAQIQIPITGGYDIYYYLNDGWYQDAQGNDAYKAGWCDQYGVLVDDEFTPGVAAWFKSVPGDGTATVSGAVSEESAKTVDCPAGFALRANTFPITVTLNTAAMTSEDIVGVDYDSGNVFQSTAPQIQIPIPGGYEIYYYLNDGWYQDAQGNDAYKAGWCDQYGVLSSDTISAGQGFWTKGVTGTFTLKFTK